MQRNFYKELLNRSPKENYTSAILPEQSLPLRKPIKQLIKQLPPANFSINNTKKNLQGKQKYDTME